MKAHRSVKNKFYFFVIIPLFCLFCSCTTPTQITPVPKELSYLPPQFDLIAEKDKESVDLQLKEIREKHSELNTHWWVDYRRARLWEETQPQVSCASYLKLTQDPHFPLAKIALLRTYSFCENTDLVAAHISPMTVSSFPEWLKPLTVDIALKFYRKNKLLPEQFAFALENSKLVNSSTDKINYVQEALNVAKELKDQEKIESAQNRLYRLAPRFIPQPQPQNFFDVAYDYRKSRNFIQAQNFYQQIIKHPAFTFKEKIRAWNGLRMTYKIKGDKKKYLDVTIKIASLVKQQWVRRKKNDPLLNRQYLDSFLTLARTYWTLGHSQAAQNILSLATKELQGKLKLNEVYWLRGRMAEEKGLYPSAIHWFRQGLNEVNNNVNNNSNGNGNGKLKTELNDDTEKIKWYLAWNLRKEKKFSETITHLEELHQSTSNEFARNRYAYWLAETYRQTQDLSKSQALFNQLQTDDPTGYYGLLARRATSTPIRFESSLIQTATHPMSRIDKSDVDFVEWLSAVGEREVAQLYLDTLAINNKKKQLQSTDFWTQLLPYYLQSGNYLGLYRQLSSLSTDQRNLIINQFPHFLFPTPYPEYVTQSTQRFGISSDLVYAVMRQESAFDPLARSSADAFGLLQLIPDVAHRTATQINLSFKNPEELYEPYTNIILGAAFLRELWDKFNGQFILAVASYNASEEAIMGWIRSRFRGDTVEFIEDIPYEETRAYVRLVLRNLVFYSLINSGHKSIVFPEWTLSLSAPSTISSH